MAKQFSGTIRDGWANFIESTWVASGAPVLKLRNGTMPANCAAADAGAALSTMTLPTDCLTAASGGNGQVTKNGTWQQLLADASGTPTHFRIYNNAQTVCHMQGTVGGPSSGMDMELSSATITANYVVTVTTFTLTMPHA